MMRFVDSNGGWGHTFWIVGRKIVRCGPKDAVRAFFARVLPSFQFPERRYRRFLALHEPQWVNRQSAPLPPDFIPPRIAVYASSDSGSDGRDSLRNAAWDGVPIRIFPSDSANRDPLQSPAKAVFHEDTAEWIVFVSLADRLRPFSLRAFARAMRDHPNAAALYADCDQLDARGRRTAPDFKPQWSPDTLRSWFYTHGIFAFRRDTLIRLLEADASLPFSLTESERYRLWLRFADDWLARSTKDRPAVIRIPGILLHRNGMAHPLERSSDVVCPADESPKISIIIPTRDHVEDLKRCIGSITERSSYGNYEILAVDNGSSDPSTLDYLHAASTQTTSRGPIIRVWRDDSPFNFSRLNNEAARRADGAYLLFLNNDTEVLSPDWMEQMLAYARLPHIGAVGARLLYPDGTLQHSGVAKVGAGPTHVFSQMAENTPNPRVQLPGNWSAVTGACLMVEKRKFDDVGGFDESYPVAYNDVDLCFRLLEAGLFNVLVPAARLVHREFASRGNDRKSEAKRAAMFDALRRLYERHPAMLDDPGYNPNLSTDQPDWLPQN